jgi:hypothetical protein
MKKEFHAMESKGVWKIVPLSSMPHGRNRKLVGNRWVYTEKSLAPTDQERLLKVLVRYLERISLIVMLHL